MKPNPGWSLASVPMRDVGVFPTVPAQASVRLPGYAQPRQAFLPSGLSLENPGGFFLSISGIAETKNFRDNFR
jgi:hypothetical protein